MLERLRELIKNEKYLYKKFGDKREYSMEYFEAQDDLLQEKKELEELLKQFRFLVDDAPELFEDNKAKQIDEWLILASIKLEDL